MNVVLLGRLVLAESENEASMKELAMMSISSNR